MICLSCHCLDREGHAAPIRQPAPPRSASDGIPEQIPQAAGNDDGGRWEVERNFARTFHHLGLYSHAVKHYEKVFGLAEQVGDDLFARQAAFDLSCISIIPGAVPLAMRCIGSGCLCDYHVRYL
ncbi:hypothetical protein BJ165DRAFT_340739 [Panaeolus papilionaceus]|nr:hypothetical protein BJ165DRAFT_340739 [Panaeolus papilionaceus]